MTALGILDFDDIDEWAPKLARVLSPLVPDSIVPQLVAAAPEYVEDVCDMLFHLSDREAVIDETLTWIRSTKIAGYHGSRLTDADIASIRAEGLIPLRAERRRHRLERALSQHPEWVKAAGQLDVAIQTHGRGGCAGLRENQVHLTLSRAGLTNSFDHYLTYGAEFDQHVAHALLGSEGKELLAHDGKPTVVQVAVPGNLALDAAHPYFSIDERRAKGEVPNLVNEFLNAWSFRLAHPRFQSRTLEVDCGMVFRSNVSAAWIRSIETLAD